MRNKIEVSKRQAANRDLVLLLRTLVEMYPDQRFSQILGNFGFVEQREVEHPSGDFGYNMWTDEYHKEPQDLLARVKQALDKVHRGEQT